MDGFDQERRRRQKEKAAVFRLVCMDLLLTGLVLCVFAVFHHVLPMVRQQIEGPPAPIATVPLKISDSLAETEEPVGTEEPQEPEETEEPEEPAPDPSDWKALFAEYFTDEVTVTENSYTSPETAVTISEHTMTYQNDRRSWEVTYYVADIYLAGIESLRTVTPEKRVYDNAMNIMGYSGALLGINGDMAVGTRLGLCIQNGEIYSTEKPVGDYCVLFYDGTVETYGPEEYDEETLMAREPYQVWQFGPELLDEEGMPKAEFNISSNLAQRHPRTAFGYYEPGHYCFVVVDGRQVGYSLGLPIEGMAELMADLGCVRAFNLDGGASSQMVFLGKWVNKPFQDRYLSDMLVIAGPREEEGTE